ncbi:MAG TPA: hypothetical protein VM597_18325 [Gemmataceae bacterium]|nr:hypothetical protein [Gemmataceae bacterium]
MRMTTDRRRTAALALVAAAVFALAGCDGGRQRTSGPGAEKPTGTGPAPGPSGPAAASPKAAAEAVLKTLTEGTAAADSFTPAFRAKVAPPKTDDDRKAGYSEAALKKWLGRFEGTRFAVFGEPAVFGDKVVARGRSETGAVKDAFSLRLVKAGDGPKIDWLQRADRMGTEFTVPADADLAAAQDAARNFIDALMSADPAAAQLSMAAPWKRAIAPPPPNSTETHDAGYLTRLLKSWRDPKAVSYMLPKQELTPAKDGADFTAVLDAGGGTKTTYAMKLSKEPATGHWVVGAFDKQ